MKWIKTPQAYLVHSHCEGNDGTNLGWVAELADSGKMTYQAWICNGYDGATELGNNHKTPRLAQMAVERELLKGWFRYEYGWLGGYKPYLHVFMKGNDDKQIARKSYYYQYAGQSKTILARARREFLNEL